jgi:hypothetical protein
MMRERAEVLVIAVCFAQGKLRDEKITFTIEN